MKIRTALTVVTALAALAVAAPMASAETASSAVASSSATVSVSSSSIDPIEQDASASSEVLAPAAEETAAAATAGDALALSSRVSRPQPCGSVAQRGESTTGIVKTRGTVTFWVCGVRDYGRNTLKVFNYHTQLNGGVSLHWSKSYIVIRNLTTNRIGWQGYCNLGGIPSSQSIPFFGAYTLLRPSVKTCSTTRPLSSKGLYALESRFCYDVKNDNKDYRCLNSTAYL